MKIKPERILIAEIIRTGLTLDDFRERLGLSEAQLIDLLTGEYVNILTKEQIETLAGDLADIFGTTQELWLQVYSECLP